MDFIFAPETLQDDNQYQCEVCNKKVDAIKGQKFGKLPDVLCLSLSRFDMDYQTWQRIKINSSYHFDLELDLSKITGKSEDQVYDLFSVIIHRGDAYGGHYHAIIRDTLEERWLLKTVNPTSSSSTTTLADDSNDQDGDHNLAPGNVSFFEDSKDLPDELEALLKEELYAFTTTSTDKSTIALKEAGPTDKKANEECPDPFPTKITRGPENDHLFEGWFDFDDTRVKEFDVNKLHKYFGSSKESAYILFYRKRSQHLKKDEFNNMKPCDSVYQELLTLNEAMHKERDFYQKMKNKLKIKVGLAQSIIDPVTLNTLVDFESAKEAFLTEFVLDFSTPVVKIWEKISNQFQMDSSTFTVVMFEKEENGNLNFPQILPRFVGLDSWTTVDDLNIFHDTNWIVLPIGDPLEALLQPKLSLKNCVSHVVVEVMTTTASDGTSSTAKPKTTRMSVPRFMSDNELLTILQPVVDWPLQLHDISVINGGDLTNMVEVPAIMRAQGIPYNEFEFKIKRLQADGGENGADQILKVVENGQDAFYEDGTVKSILLTREGVEGCTKIYVDYATPLDSILDAIKQRYGCPVGQAVRLRNLGDDHLYTRKELSSSLIDLKYEEGSQKLCLENGRIPLNGEVSVKVKYDVYDQTGEKIEVTEDFMMHISNKLLDYIPQIESRFAVLMEEHSIYTTNWMEEPVTCIKNIGMTIERLKFDNSTVLMLMNNMQGTSQEMRTYRITFSETGLPNSGVEIGSIKINENRTIDRLIGDIFDLMQKSEVVVEKYGDKLVRDL